MKADPVCPIWVLSTREEKAMKSMVALRIQEAPP